MPHICTRCNNVFDSGEDILKGCPVCGWKKFMFVAKQAAEKKDQPEKEQIIPEAMGVRVPPQRRPKVEKEPEKKSPGSAAAYCAACHSASSPACHWGSRLRRREQ